MIKYTKSAWHFSVLKFRGNLKMADDYCEELVMLGIVQSPKTQSVSHAKASMIIENNHTNMR